MYGGVQRSNALAFPDIIIIGYIDVFNIFD